jgi:hypothetical protein
VVTAWGFRRLRYARVKSLGIAVPESVSSVHQRPPARSSADLGHAGRFPALVSVSALVRAGQNGCRSTSKLNVAGSSPVSRSCTSKPRHHLGAGASRVVRNSAQNSAGLGDNAPLFRPVYLPPPRPAHSPVEIPDTSAACAVSSASSIAHSAACCRSPAKVLVSTASASRGASASSPVALVSR